jgi:hypothetical protein
MTPFPKIRLVLFAIVLGLWSWSSWENHLQRQIVNLRLVGPMVALETGTRGTWRITWPEWPERKGGPSLEVYGLPFSVGPDDANGVQLLLRVQPENALELGPTHVKDSEGWFEAGHPNNSYWLAILNRSRASEVEYWVKRADLGAGQKVRLQISGARDSDLLEGAIVGELLSDVLALVVGGPLFLSIVVTFARRWLERRREARVVAGQPESA